MDELNGVKNCVMMMAKTCRFIEGLVMEVKCKSWNKLTRNSQQKHYLNFACVYDNSLMGRYG